MYSMRHILEAHTPTNQILGVEKQSLFSQTTCNTSRSYFVYGI